MVDFEKIAREYGWVELPGTGVLWRAPKTMTERNTAYRVDNAKNWEEACWIDSLHPDAKVFEEQEK